MEEIRKWRAPNNDYGPENGLDTGDVETFKKEPVLSLAREIGQNSIDANIGTLPTRIQYKIFEVDRDAIPGMDELTEWIKRCYEYKKDLPKEADILKSMLMLSQKEKIKCLRISDTNTKGLEGAYDNNEEKPFYLLTKGSGISYKTGSSGGSKGIGKYAAFVNSGLNTVFYSTYNKDEERGYIGISKLRSAPIPESDGLKTQGIMYYSRNEKKEPILEELSLEDGYERKQGDYGTDVYILGFKADSDWKWSIVSKLLESFMVAIYNESLVVEVDDIIVDKEHLKELVYSSELVKVSYKRTLKDIISQYRLLVDDDVESKTFNILDYGDVNIKVKKYEYMENEDATQKCVMVRYPYMKIKMTSRLANLPFSAMCVIEDNSLNQMLREVENPQHTDWEFNRIDDKAHRKKVKDAEKALMNIIKDYIKEVLADENKTETDVYGAGDYLPSLDDGNFEGEEKSVDEKQTVSPPKRNTAAEPKKVKVDEANEAFEHDEGDLDGDGTDGKKEGDSDGIPNPNPYDDPNDSGEGNVVDGDKPILKKVPLSGIKYTNIIVDKKIGKYDIVFVSPYDEDDCDLEIKMCGEANDTYKVEITNAYINGEEAKVVDGKIVDIKIQKGVKYKITYISGKTQIFSSEVIMNAYRQ